MHAGTPLLWVSNFAAHKLSAKAVHTPYLRAVAACQRHLAQMHGIHYLDWWRGVSEGRLAVNENDFHLTPRSFRITARMLLASLGMPLDNRLAPPQEEPFESLRREVRSQATVHFAGPLSSPGIRDDDDWREIDDLKPFAILHESFVAEQADAPTFHERCNRSWHVGHDTHGLANHTKSRLGTSIPWCMLSVSACAIIMSLLAFSKALMESTDIWSMDLADPDG